MVILELNKSRLFNHNKNILNTTTKNTKDKPELNFKDILNSEIKKKKGE